VGHTARLGRYALRFRGKRDQNDLHDPRRTAAGTRRLSGAAASVP
jgi:hypothetical protein